jgi:hypothetical protein
MLVPPRQQEQAWHDLTPPRCGQVLYSQSNPAVDNAVYFDAIEDRSALSGTDVKGFLSKFSTVTYNRPPEDLVGPNAVRAAQLISCFSSLRVTRSLLPRRFYSSTNVWTMG